MDYPCAKFGDFTFSRFGFIARTDRRDRRGGSTLYSRKYVTIPSASVMNTTSSARLS